MAFYGAEVIYDGVPSSLYDLRIMDFDTSGEKDSPAGSEMTIYEKYIYRKSKAFYFGKTQNTPLEFDLTLGSKNPIDAVTRSAIQKLFLGRATYLPFQVVQDDAQSLVFYTLFTSATNKYVGNVQYSITLHGHCDSAYARTFPQTLTYSFSGNNVVNFDFNFYNQSDDSEYLKPIITFSLNSVGNFFQLTNITDNNRIFLFSDIQPNEEIVVDNYRETISSSTGLVRLGNFNKKFFRLKPNNNELNIQSGIGDFSMTYTLNKNVGA